MAVSENSDTELGELIRRARGGDAEALGEVVSRTGDKLGRRAQNLLGEALGARMRASDLLQSSYLQIVRGIEDFRGEDEGAFVAWAGRILENTVRDRGRYFSRKKRKGDLPEASGVNPAGPAAAEEITITGPGPLTSLDFSDQLALFARAIGSLPERQRRVLELRMDEGCSHEEIAETLGIQVGASRVLLARARAALLVEMERLQS